MLSVDTCLEVVAPHLDPALVSPEQLTIIREVARVLPAFSEELFECRLAGQESGADFITTAKRGADERQLTQWLDTYPDGPLARWSAGQIMELCRLWADPASPLAAATSRLWLEFDLGPGEHRGGASVHLGIADRLPTGQRNALICSVFELLYARTMPASTWSCVELCLAGRQELYAIGFMLQRPTQPVRIILSGIRPSSLPAFLTGVGWSGDLDQVGYLTSLLARFARFTLVNLDVHERILPRVGVEYFVQFPHAPVSSAWQEVLETLVEREMCTQEKRAGLLSWPGQCLAYFLVPRLFVRTLNHIKITHELDGSCYAKAYFGSHHH
jgi:hypothetical protein